MQVGAVSHVSCYRVRSFLLAIISARDSAPRSVGRQPWKTTYARLRIATRGREATTNALCQTREHEVTPSLSPEILQRQRAEHELRESEARVRAILDCALSAVIVINAEGRIIDWNAHAEVIFGRTRADALGQRLAETIIPPRYREAHDRGLKHFLATGEGPVFHQLIELAALRRDGTEFPIELSISPLKSGDAVTFCGFITDISQRKRGEAALNSGTAGALGRARPDGERCCS